MVEPVRQHFQHKCLRERGYVFEKIFVGAGTIWLGIVQQVSSGSFATDRCAMKIGPCPQCPESDGGRSSCRPSRWARFGRNAPSPQAAAYRPPGRRGGCPLAPHRPGRAGFPHPVPHARDSLTMSWTTISAVLHTGTRCSGSLLGSAISSAIHAVSWTQVKGPESPQCFSTWFSPRGASLPSFGSQRAWFPALTGTMKALRLPTCASAVAYFVRFRRPT